jgi:hypothetical protein
MGILYLFAKDKMWEFQKSLGRWLGNPTVDDWQKTAPETDSNLAGILWILGAFLLLVFWIWAANWAAN